MHRLFKISVFLLLSHFAAAQCDTTGILLELQATTNLNGLLIGDDKCIKKAVVMSPLVVSNDTLYFTGGGAGSVTSVGLSLPSIFLVSGSPVTTSGTLTGTLATQSANTFFRGPTSGGAATPTFGLITTADITGLLVANNGVSDNEAGGVYRLGNVYMNLPDAAFTTNRKININDNTLFIGDNSDSTLLGIFGLDGRVGIRTTAASRALHVNGEVRITDLTTDTPTLIVGADADGDLGAITVSTGLSLSGGVLTSTVTAYTDEQAQDAVGTILTDGSIIDFTYNDATPSITATVINNSIGNSQIRQGVARSVIGVTGNATANVADIQGTTDQVLRVNTTGNALGFGQIATGGITDDAVTYAKLQNISTNNRILGRITAGAGNAEELTAANMQTILGYLDGALTNPRIPYASDANTLTDNANLVWLNGSQEIMVGGGATLDARFSHRATANITGDSKFSNGDNNVSGTYEMRLANTRNVSNTGNSKLTLQTGGTAAGDPFIYLNVPGGGNVSIGIDNSDGDKIKFSPGAAAPGANANNGLVITNTATPFVGINTDNPGHALDVAGSARAVNLRNTLAAPTVGTLGTGLGTGPTIDLVDGGNNGFIIWFTTGTAPAANGNLFRVTYANPFAVYSFPVWSADNNNAATDYNKFTRSGASPAWFDWKANGTLTANTQYRFIFNVMGL
jgi:hypothetical protein